MSGTYDEFMKEVGVILGSAMGLSLLDLADVASYNMYEDGAEPVEVAYEALTNEGMSNAEATAMLYN